MRLCHYERVCVLSPIPEPIKMTLEMQNHAVELL